MPYDVTIKHLPPFALYDLKGPQKAVEKWGKLKLPDAPKRLNESKGNTLCHIGPDHWLLRADLANEAALETQLRPAEAPANISIVRISDTQTFFRITGPDAAQVVSIGCPMDLHSGVFPDPAVSFTEFFTLKALILRCAGGFDVAVEQSFGKMVADYLFRATV